MHQKMQRHERADDHHCNDGEREANALFDDRADLRAETLKQKRHRKETRTAREDRAADQDQQRKFQNSAKQF